ncbi:hypothetical protein [Streptomyces lasalocidi]|nr:hypothetical protein [Streptomyces lasalocidi]
MPPPGTSPAQLIAAGLGVAPLTRINPVLPLTRASCTGNRHRKFVHGK